MWLGVGWSFGIGKVSSWAIFQPIETAEFSVAIVKAIITNLAIVLLVDND